MKKIIKLTKQDWWEACVNSGTTKSWSADMIRNLNKSLAKKQGKN